MQKIMRSLKGVEVKGKRVLLLTSLNVPILPDGSVGDEFRLKRDLPTIEFLANEGAKIILVGYLGRKGETLAPVATALQKLLPAIKISFTSDPVQSVGAHIEQLPQGECLMLENMRRENGEESDDPALVAELAKLADLFVDDAFAEAHRAYASDWGVAKLLPSYAGFLMEEEVARLSPALTPPAGALAIVGGAKFETKQPLLEKLLGTYPEILLGGALATDLLKARGMPVGASLTSKDPVPVSLAEDERIILPIDLVVENASGVSRTIHTGDVRTDERIVDAGPATIAAWVEKIKNAKFVLWNGPLGVYEKGYVAGTDALAKAITESSCVAVLGGGDTAAALAQFTFDPARVFISTGGGAMLEFLAQGGSLPGVDVLKN